jgi:hypothetical protein
MAPDSLSSPPDDPRLLDRAVRLQYALTLDDLTDAFAAQNAAHRPRFLRRPRTLTVVAGVVLAVVLADALIFHIVGLTVVATLIGWALVITPFAILVHRLPDATLRRLPVGTHWIFRLAARHLMRGTPTLTQETRTVLDDSGLCGRTETVEWTATWAQYPAFLETDRSFVLLASDRPGAQILPLPKRGLVPNDAERLRALLAEHSHRLG